ncbi:SEC-C metal-binding domain-containing protein [Bacillus sp. JJ1521]|uniref:SEC-C metal-binding domain-containing protein n=1 Tax=Bacillus sp. JJ1521 TaxID=3122957 RepID=UPI003000CC7B
MTVGRNDLCPCGSGKKYKKCCMKKNNVLQLREFKVEQFYQQKLRLVNQLGDFINEKVSGNLYYRLKSEFKDRVKLKSDKDLGGLLNFWLYFFYRYENGMRGIEWFLTEKGQRLSEEELVMAKRWAGLRPKLVQAIDKTDSQVVFLDFFTKEKYLVSAHHENIPFLTPWYSTLALLEPLEDQFYFNGVRTMASPNGFHKATTLVQKLMKQTGLDHEQVFIEYYPELLQALRDEREEDLGEKEFVQYNYKFLLSDKVLGENFLYNEECFTIDTWEDSYKKLVWLDNIQIYTDSELDGEIHIGEVLASIELKNKSLTLVSSSLKVVNQFLRKLVKARGAFQLEDDQEERITLPLNADVTQLSFSLEKGVSEYFTIIAHNKWHLQIDEPIPMLGDLSLRQLVEKGKEDLAEVWLKQSEYNLYLQLYQQYGKVEVTADFNTVRRELGLELSPFVTGGKQRQSKLLPVLHKDQRKTVILEQDILIYENLGFTPETIDNFYTKDLIEFYKEKTIGMSESTQRKYQNSLYDIREVLERSSVTNWDECDFSFWQELVINGIYEINDRVSKTKLKDMVSTVKALTKWLEKEKKFQHAQQIATLGRETEMIK